MAPSLEVALSEVLAAADRGREITRNWLEERYPDYSSDLEQALGLSQLLRGSVGPYRVLGELGRGGMGTVYLCEDRCEDRDGGRVAVKLLHRRVPLERFLSEAEVGRGIEHENIARTLDVGTDLHAGKRDLFLVLEYLEGDTLAGPLPETRCREVGLAIARGLAALHARGIVHRDLKPQNVFVCRDGAVKLLDYGVARLWPDTEAGAFVGSLLYAAPEQFWMASGDIDGCADLYALGCILFELATGVLPTGEERPSDMKPELSPFFDAVVRGLLAVDRNRRFDDAAELASILEQGEQSPWWRRGERSGGIFCREEELARMHDLYGVAMGGAGQAIGLRGEGGVGKTTLAEQFLSELPAEVRVLRGLDALKDHAGHLESMPMLAQRFSARTLVRDEYQTAFVYMMRGVAPAVIVVEDLHAADVSDQAVVAALAQAASEHEILLIVTSREETGLKELRLERLDESAVSAMVAAELSSVGPDVAARAYAISEGNPYFVRALLKAWRADGQLVQDGGRWRLAGDPQARELEKLVEARLAEIDAVDRNVLDVAACCGFEFDLDVVSRICGVDAAARLARLDLVRGDRFDHHMTHEVIYALADQRTHHAALGRLLGDARHLLLGGRGADVVGELPEIGERLVTTMQFERALEVSRLALEEEGLLAGRERLSMMCVAVRALQHLGRHEDTHREAAATIELADELGDTAHSIEGRLLLAANFGETVEHDRAEQVLHEAVALATPAGQKRLRHLTLIALCGVLAHRGKLLAALDVARQLKQQLLDTQEVNRAQIWEAVGKAEFIGGEYEEAVRCFSECLKYARCPDQVRLVASAEGHMGIALMHLGDLDAALEHTRRASDTARQSGWRYGRAMATGVVGEILLRLGRSAEALDAIHEQLEVSRELGVGDGVERASLLIASTRINLGQYVLAEEALNGVDFEGGRQRWSALRARAELAHAAGDDERELAHLDRVLSGVDASFVPVTGNVLCMKGRLCGRSGRSDEARDSYARALELGRRTGMESVVVEALCGLAKLPDGDFALAEAELERAEPRLMLDCRLRARHALWEATGDARHLLEARRLLHCLKVHAPPDAYETVIRDVALHRRIHADSERVFGGPTKVEDTPPRHGSCRTHVGSVSMHVPDPGGRALRAGRCKCLDHAIALLDVAARACSRCRVVTCVLSVTSASEREVAVQEE